MVAHAFYSSIQEAEASGSLEFRASLVLIGATQRNPVWGVGAELVNEYRSGGEELVS